MNESAPMLLGISIGDPNGIGPELLIQTFADTPISDRYTPLVYGSSRILNAHRKNLKVNKFQYHVVPDASQALPGRLNLIECVPHTEPVDIGQPTPAGGKAAFMAFTRAMEDAVAGHIHALVTLPVDKATYQQHDPQFKGHTEVLTAAFGARDALMLMVDEQLRLGLVTGHVPLREVAQHLSTPRIAHKIKLMHDTLRFDFDLPQPRIAVLGLNPHASDSGLLGHEEQEFIAPAVALAVQKGVMALGPYPADGFFAARTYREFDAVLAMYHDQGLIPFKFLSGYAGVNFTAGLPFVRTSPDHGTAYNIAGQGIADPTSFRQAIHMAVGIFHTRSELRPLAEGSLDAQRRKTPPAAPAKG